MLRKSWRGFDTAIDEGGVPRSSRPCMIALITSCLFSLRRGGGRSSSCLPTWDESCLWRAVDFREVSRRHSAGRGERSTLPLKRGGSPGRLDKVLTPC